MTEEAMFTETFGMVANDGEDGFISEIESGDFGVESGNEAVGVGDGLLVSLELVFCRGREPLGDFIGVVRYGAHYNEEEGFGA